MRNTCPAKVTGTDKKVFHNHLAGQSEESSRGTTCSTRTVVGGLTYALPYGVAPPGSIVLGGTSESFTVHFDNWDSRTEVVTPAKLPASF